MKINVKAFALTAGIFWGLALLIFTWWIMIFDGAQGYVPFVSQIYRGYEISIPGSFIGLACGLVDGTIVGALFAWVYNYFQGKMSSGPE